MKEKKPRDGYLTPCVEIIRLQQCDLIQTSGAPYWDDGVLNDGWT